MAQLHNQLNRGSLTSALKKALGLTKSEGGLERYGETLQPIIDLWRLPEWAFLRGERLCGARRNEAAGAATELSSVALLNPSTTRLLIVVESASVSLPTASSVRCSIATEAQVAALVSDTAGSNVDTRFANVTEPLGRLRSEAVAALIGVFIEEQNFLASDAREILAARGVVLSPGFALVLQNTDDAALLNTSWRWRERAAFRDELAPGG